MLKNIIFSTFVAIATFTISATDALAQLPKSFADLVEEYSPAVVNISTSSEPKKIKNRPNGRGGQQSPFPPGHPFQGSPFEELFKDFFENMPQDQTGRPMRSLGSGVIISEDGYVITNSHVVEGADKIVVRMEGDKDEFKAKLIGRDPKIDLALLKIESKKSFPYASLGDSDKVRVGDWAIAIGNPFGLGGTVTSGIISARGRNINVGPYDDFLQTDAAINPGNSGGPLFDVDGNIIGINTAILTRSGGSQGIGFSIPANTVKLIIDQIKEHGRPIRGWLGVRIQTVTPELAEAFGLKENSGALVAAVVDGSPAAKAGAKEGDVIIAFNDVEISEMSELPRVVAQTKVGKKVPLVVMRKGKKKTLYAKIAELEEDDITPQTEEVGEPEDVLGMTLQKIDEQLRTESKLDDDVKGLAVIAIDSGSAAAKGGIRRGDVLIEVNRMKVTSVEEATKAVEKGKGKTLLMLVHRRGSNLFVAVKPADTE